MSEYIYLIAPIAGWATSQAIKLSLKRLKNKHLELGDLLSSGNMPSSHVSGPSAFLVVVANQQGISSPLFAISLMFMVLTAYDSIGVRRTAEEGAKAINKISHKLGLSARSDHVYKGHTPIEVLAGIAVGAVAGLITMVSL